MSERQTQVQLKVERLGLILPLALLIAVLIYQLVFARWVHMQLGEELHYFSEIAFIGTVGPIATHLALKKTSSWFAEVEAAKEKVKAFEQKLASITSMSAEAIIGLEANGSIEMWRRHYNTDRPHSSLSYRPPAPAAVVVQPSQIQQVGLT